MNIINLRKKGMGSSTGSGKDEPSPPFRKKTQQVEELWEKIKYHKG